MTTTEQPETGTRFDFDFAVAVDDLSDTPVQHHPNRWQLHRAGITNVWFYYDTEFDFSGGRLVLRGTNGSGKSRALEMLLPFLFDADRRRMDATGSGKVQLTDLMKAGAEGASNRVGYLWVELRRPLDDTDPLDADLLASGATHTWITLGAHLRYSSSTTEVKVHYFTTDLRVGHDLPLMTEAREPLSRDRLTELVGADRVVVSPATHRDRVRATVFGLTGESGAERYNGLLQLLHTLRSPDVGNRIEEGRLPQILTDALPPLAENALNAAGEQLDSLSETRAQQERLEAALEHVKTFLGTYRRYAAATIATSAQQARERADKVTTQTRLADELRTRHDQLEGERVDAQTLVDELVVAISELDATIVGIKESPAYAAARDLDARRGTVTALARTAEIGLAGAATARDREAALVADADAAAGDVVDAASRAGADADQARIALTEGGVPAGVLASIPTQVHASADEPALKSASVRVHRDDDPVALTRPEPSVLRVVPDDLASAVAGVEQVQRVAAARSDQAFHRAREARQVDTLRSTADSAQERSSELDQTREKFEGEATARAEDLAQAVETYLRAWHSWRIDAATVTAFTTTDTGTGRAVILDDALAQTAAAAISADDLYTAGEELLTALDRAAARAAEPVRDLHTRRLAALDTADTSDAQRAADLGREADALRAAVDPAPPLSPWAMPADGVMLWQAVDFQDTLDADQRAGLEGALLASGLLNATLSVDGTAHAVDGATLVSATGPQATHPLSTLLRPDPAADVDQDLVAALLERVSTAPSTGAAGTPNGAGQAVDEDVPLAVAVCGAWSNGPLRGTHQRDRARHVGAAARAAAREERLVEIATELATLAAAAEQRALDAAQTRDLIAALKQVVATAPATRPIHSARTRLDDAARRADEAAAAAVTAARIAQERRAEWAAAREAHRAVCAELAFPDGAEALDEVGRASRSAAGRCRDAVTSLRRTDEAHTKHQARLDQLPAAAKAREGAELAATSDWAVWHREAAEFAAIEANVGADASTAQAELKQARELHRAHSDDLERWRSEYSNLVAQCATALVNADNAADDVATAKVTLTDATSELLRRLALPGLAAAAFTNDLEPPSLPEITPKAVRDLTLKLEEGLRAHQGKADENTLLAAQQRLERDLSGTFDVTPRIDDGVRLVTLSDATGSRSIAQAAVGLDQAAATGRSALTDRERDVFTEFVLGGVAEELRRRLNQAGELVDAMNASLAEIRTSHGIGVKLRWKLDDDSDRTASRIRELVATVGQLRSAEQTSELTDLLRARVSEAFDADPSAGYAVHLAGALDYRDWHRMNVIILGPNPGQERLIGRKAKLSQGETRFVSYVALFAAVDAYLSGLPNPDRALRMLLLDDAFAKVDDPTIGELMGLLVRLDLDFAMTGHALWGTYPQVPSLDAYEVRRADEGAAVTTHTHWDGRNRHLRAAR
ncbi:TIGR02680 family protein [Nocardioides sp. T5]|uniref:TIGR02680 family protein n=1 Tax=Nocardioides sp. T5 TaxID=3400182 RepID=UPI003A8BDC5C